MGLAVDVNLSEVIEARKADELKLQLSAMADEEDEPQNFDGWTVSRKQCIKITLGDREAVDKFFNENFSHLRACAYRFINSSPFAIRKNFYDKNGRFTGYNVGIVEADDCINQVYLDMRRGFLVFDFEKIKNCRKFISRAFFHSFRYAGVGGFGDEDGSYIVGER